MWLWSCGSGGLNVYIHLSVSTPGLRRGDLDAVLVGHLLQLVPRVLIRLPRWRFLHHLSSSSVCGHGSVAHTATRRSVRAGTAPSDSGQFGRHPARRCDAPHVRHRTPGGATALSKRSCCAGGITGPCMKRGSVSRAVQRRTCKIHLAEWASVTGGARSAGLDREVARPDGGSAGRGGCDH